MILELGLVASLGLNGMVYNERAPKPFKSKEVGAMPAINLEMELGNEI